MSRAVFLRFHAPWLRSVTLAFLLLIPALTTAFADLTNRWSFNNATGTAGHLLSLPDSLSSAPAIVTGTGATFTGTALRLPGSGSTATPGTIASNVIPAYIDLPNGLISSKTNLTVELWATPRGTLGNQRLLDFGRMSLAVGVGTGAAAGEVRSDSAVAVGTTGPANVDNLNLNITRAGSLNFQRIEGRINGGTAVQGDTSLAAATSVENHYVFVFENGIGSFGTAGGRASWYQNETLASAIDVNFRLLNIEDVNNWLGRSQFTADPLSQIDYNEVRVYNHAFLPTEVSASRAVGPNPAAVPVVQPDSVTINPGQKAAINVRGNDTNAVTLEVMTPPTFGTAVLDAYGRIRYAHTTGSPSTDSFTYRARNAAGWSSPTTVNVNFSSALRQTTPMLNVPSTPPPTAYEVVDAFGSLTFNQPTALKSPPSDTQRLFVATKGGVISVIPNVTAASPTSSTVLTISTGTNGLLNGRVPAETLSTASEQGLLSVAFHPNFASNGYLFFTYSVTISGVTYERLSRITLNNPNSAAPTANLTSERVLIQQVDEATNHNGGDLQFGADGYLYYSTGDEGNQNDSFNNSQTITKDFHCALLRIDVDRLPANLEPNTHPNPSESSPATSAIPTYETSPGSGIFTAAYKVPVDNPFVTVAQGGTWNGLHNGVQIGSGTAGAYVRSEFWATGFRNPWRFSFDPPTGDLWLADVGGGAREEINIVVKGANYGWAYREGMINGPKSGSAPANFDTLYGTRPIHDYQHIEGPTGGNSISGGFVYRGSRFPELVGSYIYADYVSGNIWSIRRSGANGATTPIRLAGEGGIVAFAPDPANGDILMADVDSNRIRRIVGGVPAGGYPEQLGETGIFADLADLSPNPGLVSYDVNLPFWSDYAIKRRWFTIPDALGKMTWLRDGLWTFPTGQVWVKHFDLEMTRGNPATKRRVETRVLVKNAGGAYGVSYRWNTAQTEATLVQDEGVSIPFNITVGTATVIQSWRIPSRAECLTCHTPQAGHALSSNTRQLNLTGTMNGFSGNEIALLHNAGYFSNTPESPNVLPRHVRPDETSFPIEARVRSYLTVNCAYCHKTGGTAAPANWDGRAELTLDQTGLINGIPSSNGGNPLNKLVVPGDTTHSIVLNRMAVTNGFARMPPLGSSELDQTNIALVTNWINSSLPLRQTYADWRTAQSLPPTAEGDPGSDADFDGWNNYGEFLGGTAPLNGASFVLPGATPAGANVTVTLSVPANRSVQIETSTDLLNWTLWDVPGNQGLPTPGGVITLSGPRAGSNQFFRALLKEN